MRCSAVGTEVDEPDVADLVGAPRWCSPEGRDEGLPIYQLAVGQHHGHILTAVHGELMSAGAVA